jgi:hypothetical protein
VAVIIVVLLAFAAIVVDAGAVYARRRQLQTAADAAALAGVQELPNDPGSAVAVADAYASDSAYSANHGQPVVGTYDIQSIYGSNDAIEAYVRDPGYGLFFARAMGFESEPVEARATAVVASPSVIGSGVMPFGIMSKEPSGTAPFGYAFNELVRLKQGSQGGEAGNFQFLDLVGGELDQGGGAPDVYNPLANGGVDEPVAIGEEYYSQTGINGTQVSNKLNQWIGADACAFSTVVELNDDGTVSILDPDCHRIIICPIILNAVTGEPNWPPGSSDPVVIIGFAYFFVESIGATGPECYVDGRFIRPLTPDDDILQWGPIDPYGAIGYRLID